MPFVLMDSDFVLRIIFSGLTKGSIYALLALGYTMVYGVIKLINFAHGEIYMLASFTALIIITILSVFNLPLFALAILAILIAALYASFYGYTMEKIAYKNLRNAPRLSALISAIGMSMFLQNYVRVAQTANFVSMPKLFNDIAIFDDISFINAPQLIIYATTAIAMVGLTLFIRYTRTGTSMRALSQEPTMSLLLGININRVISITFLIGSSTAAIGAFLISTYIGQINFYMGFIAGIKAFVAAVLGGIGSIPGAVLGSFILGLSESIGAGFISSDYEDVIAFLFLIIILLFKPSGLLGVSDKQKV